MTNCRTFAALFAQIVNIIMSKNLVIVESPAKAKTIEKYLGKDYHVMSSQGHIRDIEGVGKNGIGIDFANNYAPNYVIDPQKKHLLNSLKQEVQKADTVWLASDEDREGEAIAWHLQQVLNLDQEHTKRIVFHEITKQAILESIEHPRGIDYDLVNAQQARRVVDRIVGFELSPVLWKKITTGLSAGRVQSVAVRLVVEREREIEDFKQSCHYRVNADFIGKNAEGEDVNLRTELNHKFSTLEEVTKFLEECQSVVFSIRSVVQKPTHRSPAPPFTTSSLQQEAARKLKFPVAKTMRLAQALYESGHITYMRTDSVNLSSLAINTAREEIVSLYGEQYHKMRQYHTSTKGAQEAHEAIRPTFMSSHTAGANADEKRLYDLIWKRTMACQMSDAQLLSTRIEVTSDNIPYQFVATGEQVIFDGFMRMYIQSNDDETGDTPDVLPQIAEGTSLNATQIVAQESFTKPPLRYTEASLVKKMEELGIGRPSTYATIIETIQNRHYVERGSVQGKKRAVQVIILENSKIKKGEKQETYGADNQKLLPTDLGRLTNDFLVDQFPDILSYDFTARQEETFDEIAEGKADWVKTIDTFYHTFHPMIDSVPAGKMAGRLLGNDPKTGEPVYAKVSRIGPCIQIGSADVDKPRFVSLHKGQSLFTITLDEALSLFEDNKPKVLMQIDGEDVVYGEGKYGPYVRYNNQFYSIPKDTNPSTLTQEDVQQLIDKQRQMNEPLKVWGEIQLMQGRYGAYLKTPKGNIRIPKNIDINTLTEEQAKEIAEKDTPKTPFRRKK